MFKQIADRYPPREDIDLASLGDMVSGVVEGGLILQRALGEPDTIPAQIMQLRTYIKLLFSSRS